MARSDEFKPVIKHREILTMTIARVLLVDDEKAFVTANAKILNNRGYDVLTAFDGKEALRILAEKNETDIEVVVLDVKMPGMDGLAVLAEIKDRFPLVEVILLSGHASFESAVQGLKIGAGDYLMKPCRTDELLGKIEEAREKRKINEEKRRYREATGKTDPAVS
jgi:DNA-binding NtrC family response regulator